MRSRRGKRTWLDHLLANSWLLIPLGVIGAILVLAITQRQPSRLEQFTVESPGTPLPAEPAGTNRPGQQFPDQGQEHIPETETVSYNSNPPTSGPHYDTPAPWGIYNTDPPQDEQLVHNLEHGGVIISYHPERVDEQTLEQLRSQVRELSQINPRVMLTPRPNLEVPLALTAWTYLQELDRYDPAAVRSFYDAHIGRGPECQQGQCPP
jgi:hypothetical protein